MSFVNGEPGINVGIKRQPGSNVIEIKDAMMVVADELNRDLENFRSAMEGHDFEEAFVAFLRGLQRAAKRRNTTVYLLLTSGILDRSQELEIADCVDATILFHWEEAGAQRRQRVMYFGKFRGVMPRLEDRDLVRFAVSISATGGFEVRNIRVVV